MKWAIGFALSLGIPARKLSAEAIIGDYLTESESPNSFCTDGHFWKPAETLKIIFDELGIPNDERTYAVSFYEHRKAVPDRGTPISDVAPHTWADQTLQSLFATIGTGNGARVVAVEMGVMPPVEASWPTEKAMESLTVLFEKYGVDGGTFWSWVNTETNLDRDSTWIQAVKLRGTDYTYNAVKKEILDMAGFHLTEVPNGSFEVGGQSPANWTIKGSGTGQRYSVAADPDLHATPWRGEYVLRMTTGGGASASVSATSEPIAVSPNTNYTTVANLRFGWQGTPSADKTASSSPEIVVSFKYYDAKGQPSKVRSEDSFHYYEEDATKGFGTFAFQYSTPSDVQSLRIEITSSCNGLPSPIVLDVDYVR